MHARTYSKVYVIGSELYTYMQLESHTSVLKSLGDGFNRLRELAEGSNPEYYLLDGVVGFATVVSTVSEARANDCFFQKTAFVDDDCRRTWKLLQIPKPRNPVVEEQDTENTSAGKRRRIHRGSAQTSGAT